MTRHRLFPLSPRHENRRSARKKQPRHLCKRVLRGGRFLQTLKTADLACAALRLEDARERFLEASRMVARWKPRHGLQAKALVAGGLEQSTRHLAERLSEYLILSGPVSTDEADALDQAALDELRSEDEP
jgi:hypothetical protein